MSALANKTPASSVAEFFARPAVLKIATGLALLILWEGVVRAFGAPFVVKPSGVFAAMPATLSNPKLWAMAWSSLSAVFLGLVISLVMGTVIGVAMGRVPWVNRVSELWVNSFYTMPMVAILPLLTMWFGFTETARFAIIIFAALFSIILNVADGVRSVPREYIEVAQSFRARRSDIWFGISLLASIPYLIAGIRLAVGRALVGTVLAEIYASVEGVGYFILVNARSLEQNVAMCAVLILAAFGIIVDAMMGYSLKRWFPWYRREGRQ